MKMDDDNNLFGFELVKELYKTQTARQEDLIILFVHWYFIKHGFRCIGIGDTKTFEPTEKGSQLLPEGWNTRPNYALRYLANSKLYLLHAIRSEEDLLLNLLRVEGEAVSSVQFPINQTVNDLGGPTPKYQDVMNLIQRDLVDPLHPGNTSETSTQTTSTNDSRDDRLRPDPLRVGRPGPYPGPAADLLRVGAADLDPLARGGGGMIFDPFAARNHVHPNRPDVGIPGRLPPGAVPPFARFDPFGPPDPDPPRPRRRLPEYGENMFM
ncbi:proteasome inhibitor PI31 subunit [Ceratina calcarata]|uniref:Proteasome inhibitor PI31 subunit n=1 Tax=Ceratina calcarata TaxID=156304 RepID=A0AAJ7S3K3_9HYME|nr:proteasome inhibitor PI31 subunit [Ceratina calcarata]XP_026670293.1 proteasome inhibitor PI31 subunit [Ceratina calcarata]